MNKLWRQSSLSFALAHVGAPAPFFAMQPASEQSTTVQTCALLQKGAPISSTA